MSSEKALNELRKATLASYLGKAGAAVRTNTSLARGFEDEHYKDMAVANKHSPYNVNGVEKDPEVYKKAEMRMKANDELSKKFKLGAKNRIKGIARAGRLLAKEETIEEGKNPSKFDEAVVNEFSSSTLAKVAQKRYQQAQAALKAEDFGGYVKGMKKSIKAGDAMTPKSGWSPEDDPVKKEEIVISPQEKYRQIKEARMAKAQKSATTHHNYYVVHDDLQKASKALKKAGIPHSVADHSKAPVDHSVVSVRHNHTDAADAALNKHGVDFGGR